MNLATAQNLILNNSRLKIASKLSKLQFSQEKTVECLPFFVEFLVFSQVIPTFSVYFQYCQWNKSAVKVLSADWLFCNCNRRFTLESRVSVDSMISVRKRHLFSTWNWPCSLQINEMSLRRFLILLKLTFSFSRVDESCP